MTRDDIIRMAREANCTTPGQVLQFTIEELKRFAAFVAAAEREKLTQAAMSAAEIAIDKAIELEREACAKVCEEHGDKWAEGNDEWSNGQATAFYYCAIAIRARGEA